MPGPKRILIVGYFSRKQLFRRYFNHENKLANGFIRAGHQVICFSDRDHAREASLFGTQRAGAKKMADKLLELAGHYRPHLILFGHTDLLPSSFYPRMREAAPDARMAAYCVDALFRQETISNFADRLAHMDAGFTTTGDKDKIRALDLPENKLYFLPNPVDASIETAEVHKISASDLDYDGQFLGTGIEQREEQLDAIQAGLPADYRFFCAGRAFNTHRIDSTRFLDMLAQGAVCPNLPLSDRVPEQIDHLYSSDRIAQTLGMGVTTLTLKASGLSELYDDGVLEYGDRAELVDLMTRLFHDDDLRRSIGARGHRIAHDRTDGTRIARYIAAITCGEPLPEIFWSASPL